MLLCGGKDSVHTNHTYLFLFYWFSRGQMRPSQGMNSELAQSKSKSNFEKKCINRESDKYAS